MRDLSKTVNGMAEWLTDYEWTYFFTLTTRYPLSVKSARRMVERWFNKIYVKDSRIFWVCEKNECSDGSHLHGLLYVNNDADLFGKEQFNPFGKCIKAWQEVSRSNKEDMKGFNRCQFKRYDNKRGAAGYCAKYITKYSADYDFIN